MALPTSRYTPEPLPTERNLSREVMIAMDACVEALERLSLRERHRTLRALQAYFEDEEQR